MQVTEFYEQILKLEAPWSVREARVNHAAQEIEIQASCAETLWGCPQCQQRAHLHPYERRRWRHLDTRPYKTSVVSERPRVKGPEHGTVQVIVPWAESRSRLTRWFEHW